MKTAISTTAIALLITIGLTAQETNHKSKDIEAIKAMCGCHSITFDYSETFASDTGYEYHDRYHAKAPAEWIFVEEESENKIVIQHLLVINDSMIVKHWRQDWIYENTDIYSFNKERKWNYTSLKPEAVKGQWTQKVYQVDDSPRYEGSATWVHVDGKSYWENTSDAPLPRREFSKRSDYNVMRRTNRHMLTDYGWVHAQDNEKIIRDNGVDKLLVEEKGLNKYTLIDDSKCQAGKDWWTNNKAFWELVRKEWDVIYTQNNDLKFEAKVDNKRLWKSLFELGAKYEGQSELKEKKVRKEIQSILNAYVNI